MGVDRNALQMLRGERGLLPQPLSTLALGSEGEEQPYLRLLFSSPGV
jgi:hypothetical protein